MSEFRALFSRLDEALPADRRDLRARLAGLDKRARAGKPVDPRALAAVEQALEKSAAERIRRRALVPAVTYPADLPVTAALPELRAALESAQVVVVAGETGSGKSTQLPKLCLELGRGVVGRIGHTQPRRLAARSVARRIADELGVRVGGVVGVKVRFNDETGRDTLLKVMTDGILLAETRSDPRLEAYDTIIVDEAHERSLNIDFLLGYLKRLLPRRPDLKVILTSATIDVARLSAHFGGCPVVEVAGRSYPIEHRYRPLEKDDIDEEDPRMLDAIARAIDEIDAHFAPKPADTLVFLSGEREIREVAAHLEGHFRARGGAATEILPLFARQGIEEQERIFSPGQRRRVVLATNVAETSLTVPRIHAVVDPGYARVLRYSAKSRVQRLPVERISQASARQRAGRAGRLAPGLAIRLYSEADHASRGAFTPPEILRTNLASVILQMDALGLGKAEDFPFVDPPSARMLADGRATLVELGASTIEGRLTATGRAMSLLPLDPRLSRMLLASVDERVVNEMLVVAAGLAIQDPRMRPQEARDAADFAHARFTDPTSDFLTFLRLWRAWRTETRDAEGKEFGSSARRRWCERNWLSHQRMREWVDTVQQLRELFAEHFELKVGEAGDAPDYGRFHRAVIAGFVSHIGMRTEKGEFRGPIGGSSHVPSHAPPHGSSGGTSGSASGGASGGSSGGPSGALFALHPSSTLARRAPNWVVAAELVETTRRYARICARIQPDWVVRVAPHVCTRTRFEPHFIEATGQVSAWERTSFGELVLIAKHRVPWGPIDPVSARAVFIAEGLVGYRARTAGEFLERNRALRERLEEEEARGRRRGQILEETRAFEFYDARVPADVRSTPSFEAWRREAEAKDHDILVMRDEDLLRDGAERPEQGDFPREMALDALEVPLVYAHDPDDAQDGVTARIPVEALSLVDAEPFEWMVPGLLHEKIDGLVRSLPKHLRVRLFPIEEVVAGAVEALEFGKGSLRNRLARHLSTVAGTEITARDFRTELLAPHLSMRFAVIDADGRELGAGRDLPALVGRFGAIGRDRLRASIDGATDPVARLERASVDAMPDEGVPASIRYARSGIALMGYPALVVEDGGRRVALRVLDVESAALRAHAAGVATLVAREIAEAVAHHFAYHPLAEELCSLLARAEVDDAPGFVGRCVARHAVGDATVAAREPAGLLSAVRAAERGLADAVAFAMRKIHGALVAVEEILARTRGVVADPNGEPKARILARLAGVLSGTVPIASGGHDPGASRDGRDPLPPLLRLEAIACADRDEFAQRARLVAMLLERLERLREIGPARDRAIDDELAPWRARAVAALRSRTRPLAELVSIERLLDEIEISRFAPKMPRTFPASEKRLAALLGDET
ncbi:MAG: ATP-dependent RNA helicase HrpA [Planctomycetaceae bacterium]|nr:ATP-dependent RNA helicase HrpA [Planctomycetaceae bacterium]